jgi:hypothetical protein
MVAGELQFIFNRSNQDLENEDRLWVRLGPTKSLFAQGGPDPFNTVQVCVRAF